MMPNGICLHVRIRRAIPAGNLPSRSLDPAMAGIARVVGA